MVNLVIWLAAFLCPNPTHTIENHGNCNFFHVTSVYNTETDTGGETGGIPKPTTPPPPPPPAIGY
jgi:hypothetical protein